jgi:uncharacterized protein (DUF2235 family)
MATTLEATGDTVGTIRRIVACFDGTWNTDKSNTNVARLFRQIANDTNGCPEQRRFYDEGVGTRLGERIRGGMFGAGLDVNIRQGYGWLGSQFALGQGTGLDGEGFVVGPDVFLFGFSRGAFTARSLGGMINYLGLPKLARADDAARSPSPQDDTVVTQAWKLYSERPTPQERKEAVAASADAALVKRVQEHKAAVDAHRKDHSFYPVRIHFLGVWDTVGALGIPRLFDNWTFLRPSSKYRFHDTALGKCVRHAFHAVAIDEHRQPYCVTLWTARDEQLTKEVEQRWFPGAHADVGGGYEDDLLPDPPLEWIARKAADKGLHFVNDRGIRNDDGTVPRSVARIPAAFELDGREYLSPVHDSYAEFMGGAYRVLRSLPLAGGRKYRRMLVQDDGIEQTVDPTAHKKLAAEADYRPPNLSQAGRLDVSYPIAQLEG